MGEISQCEINYKTRALSQVMMEMMYKRYALSLSSTWLPYAHKHITWNLMAPALYEVTELI